MSLLDILQTFRHGRGFGIHSPFGFRIATEIISCPYAYYAYPEIDDALRGNANLRKLRRRCRIVHRLIARLGPKEVFLSQSWPEAMRVAIRAADSRLRMLATLPQKPSEAPLIAVIHGDDLSHYLDSIKALMRSDEAIIFIAFAPDSLLSDFDRLITSGMAFRSKDARLFCIRPGIAPASHIIRL